MERSSNSLLNLQNTLPLFWYVASRYTLVMLHMPAACMHACKRKHKHSIGHYTSSSSDADIHGVVANTLHSTVHVLCHVQTWPLANLIILHPTAPHRYVFTPCPAVTMTRRRWQCWGQSLRSTLSAWPTHAHGATHTCCGTGFRLAKFADCTASWETCHTHAMTRCRTCWHMYAHVSRSSVAARRQPSTWQHTLTDCALTSVVSVHRSCLTCTMSYSEDVREARDFLDALGLQHCRVLAKIETRQSLLNFRGILATADGIIVSR